MMELPMDAITKDRRLKTGIKRSLRKLYRSISPHALRPPREILTSRYALVPPFDAIKNVRAGHPLRGFGMRETPWRPLGRSGTLLLNSPVGCERAATGGVASPTGFAAVPAAQRQLSP